jgi:hypothetical protein
VDLCRPQSCRGSSLDRRHGLGVIELVNDGVGVVDGDVQAGAARQFLSTQFLADKPFFHEVVEEFLAFIGDAPLVIHNALGPQWGVSSLR